MLVSNARAGPRKRCRRSGVSSTIGSYRVGATSTTSSSARPGCSKNIGTPSRIDGDTLTASRTDGRRRYATAAPERQARGNAAALSYEPNKAGVRCWVRAVVVVWGEFDQRVIEGDRVTTVHGDHLVEWINSQTLLPDQSRIATARHHLSRPN